MLFNLPKDQIGLAHTVSAETEGYCAPLRVAGLGEQTYLPTFTSPYRGGIYQVVRVPLDTNPSRIKIYLQTTVKITQFVGFAGFPGTDWYSNIDCYNSASTSTSAPYIFEATCNSPQNGGDYFIAIRDLTQTSYSGYITVTPEYCSSSDIRGKSCEIGKKIRQKIQID